MMRDLPALRDKIFDQLPDFTKPRLAEFEQAIRAEYTGYHIHWDGQCCIARHSDHPNISAAAMTATAALADLQMALMAAALDKSDEYNSDAHDDN